MFTIRNFLQPISLAYEVKFHSKFINKLYPSCYGSSYETALEPQFYPQNLYHQRKSTKDNQMVKNVS